MNKCKQCSKEVVSKGTKPKQFCSDACRKRWNRTQLQEQTDKRTESQADEYKRTQQTDTQVGQPTGRVIDRQIITVSETTT